ncbi:MAG TPA: helix-turn-helix domain-containing protein [Planctomycetaceae bacterium]|jgi:hypothetical protein|nr:helix-turn-helix domain-containing protein [Planctomycetaceae bacterium]
MMAPLLGFKDASFLLGVPQSHVRTLVRDHGLPHVDLPTGETKFAEPDLSRWIDEHKQPRTTAGATSGRGA